MQKTLLFLATALLIQISVPKTEAAPDISVDFFYDQLGDYGDWVEVGDYGYGWQPRDVDEDWRPYSDGRWAYTDAGWTWLSEEPYGWAVYHYGRWARLEQRGWVWIPGTEWAPAWVSWRSSPRYVGWAPLPPEASFRRNVGFSGWVDSYYDIGPSAYRFVEVRNFGAPRLRGVFVEPRENITIIQNTTNITRITYADRMVHNGGPRYEDISRQSAEPVRRLKLDRRMEIEGDRSSFRGEQMRSRVDGDSLRVFAPGFNSRTEAPPRKLAARIENVQINRGWKDAGPAPDVEKLRSKVRGEAKAPKELPPQPKFEKLAEQTPAADAQSAKEKPVAPAPGDKPRGERKPDGRVGKEAPATPGAPAAESKTPPPAETPVAAESPKKPRKPGQPGRTEKPVAPEVAGQPPVAPPKAEVQPDKAAPSGAEPASPGRKGKNRPPSELPRPTPVDPVDPKPTPDRPQLQAPQPPAPDRPVRKNERVAPPEPAPRPETPEAPRNELRKPKMERPEPPRVAPPSAERPQPRNERPPTPSTAPANAPRPEAQGEAPKPRPGKGKAKDEKKPDDGTAPKPQ
jgi:hypothetical protein